ncbi:uncharacterized protein [Setaria viridis]|uniref:uncharacterized protein isoform X2 n=1 Tax=Setaria viridis TaxID=4556 RepID=UPI003B3ADFF2
MVSGVRRVTSLYARSTDAAEESDAAQESGRGRGRGGARGREKGGAGVEGGGSGRGKGGGRGRGKARARPPSPVASSSSSEEEEVPSSHASGDEEVQVEQDQVEEEAGGSGSSSSSRIWLRGPSTLPKRPIPLERRPVIQPSWKRGFTKVGGGDHARHPNGILGLLCRLHFPGLVEFDGTTKPAYTWEHYVAVCDALDQDGRVFPNKAERVKAELWDFFRCQEGYEARAATVAHEAAKKLVKDMHYEARVQAIIDYYASYRRMKINKTKARTMKLTREQYLQVPPWWCIQHCQCWEYMVDKWCNPKWEETHNACRDRRLLMPGAPHHQGNLSLDEYAAKWSSSHGGQPCSQFKAWALSHKGKATDNIDYNPEDPPSAYSNATVHNRLNEYTTMAREVHGPEYDPSTQELDGEVVMRVGKGKKHGRYWIGDSTIDTATTPTLSQIRAKGTSSSSAIRPRPDTTWFQMEALQAQVKQERKRREEMEARMEVDWQREARRMEARVEAAERRAEQMFQYMQGVFERMGQPPPPNLFPPSPTSTPVR